MNALVPSTRSSYRSQQLEFSAGKFSASQSQSGLPRVSWLNLTNSCSASRTSCSSFGIDFYAPFRTLSTEAVKGSMVVDRDLAIARTTRRKAGWQGCGRVWKVKKPSVVQADSVPFRTGTPDA